MIMKIVQVMNQITWGYSPLMVSFPSENKIWSKLILVRKLLMSSIL